jgi:hypothetical protein
MTTSIFDRQALLAPFAVALVVASVGGVSAQEPSTFVIAAAPGYGVEDCLAEGGECGRVIADAWCEASGHGEALKFGLFNDAGTNGSTGSRPYFITCAE